MGTALNEIMQVVPLMTTSDPPGEATHWTAGAIAGLDRHPRFVFHYTPTTMPTTYNMLIKPEATT
jgi:hypothetical protein